MTKAERFMLLWNSPARSIVARTLAKRIDPAARKAHQIGRLQYTFSDNSAVYNIGRGWKILPYQPTRSPQQ